MEPSLPVRGSAVRQLGLPLPPDRMPLARAGRPLKRWRYVGVFGPGLMLCVGEARVGGIPQRWWAVAEPDGTLHERTTAGRGGVRLEPGRVLVRTPKVEINLELEEDTGEAVEVVSPHGRSWIWTRKRANTPARGKVVLPGREQLVDGTAFIDESAGYHARHTSWHWSAGLGRGDGGERLAWNLVDGVHDAPEASERAIWVDGRAREVGPVEFANDLSRVTHDRSETDGLSFDAWCAREDHTRRGLFRSDYFQPFGSFSGELPGGPRLAAGFGVMEWHDVRW